MIVCSIIIALRSLLQEKSTSSNLYKLNCEPPFQNKKKRKNQQMSSVAYSELFNSLLHLPLSLKNNNNLKKSLTEIKLLGLFNHLENLQITEN